MSKINIYLNNQYRSFSLKNDKNCKRMEIINVNYFIMNEKLIEYRAVCHFMWKKNHTNKEIYESIANTYDNQIPVLRTIQKWTKTMNDDQWSIFDRPREGRPKRTDLKEAIQNVL